jgi:hypothetical protein
MPESNLPELPASSTGKYLKDDGTWGTPGGGPGAVNWGDIGGTLSDQTDLQTALDGKEPVRGVDDNYVTDAQLVVIGNTSGTNTGDNAVNSLYSGLAASKLDVPTGTPDGTKYLRDDNTWQPISGGSGLAQYQVRRILRR